MARSSPPFSPSTATRESIPIRTIAPRVSATDAIERAKRITLGRFVRTRVEALFDHETCPSVYPAYYPDYVAYTTVTLHRYLASDRDIRFLAGIDGITGRVGEVDVEIPDRRVKAVDPATVLEPDVSESDAEAAWREWLWKYLDRKYRPIKRPETTLDDLELLYVPYWIVDYGDENSSFAVSGLTKQAEHVTDVKALAAYYDNALS